MTHRVKKSLEKLDRKLRVELLKHIQALSHDPFPKDAKKLAGYRLPTYRIRYRDFRVAYRIENQQMVLMVLVVGNRRDVYKELNRLLSG